jgi:hypothetical protein
LEHRRLAVVAALREAMAPPVAPPHDHGDRTGDEAVQAAAYAAAAPAPGQDTSFQDEVGERLSTVEHRMGEMQQHLGQVMHRLHDLETARDELEALSGEDDDREGRVSVPPLKSVGQMSAVAASALFGS